jgi:nucleoside-diphosphate-sugar epimerase
VFTNHIHADDLAAACLAALRHAGANRAYNVVDDSDLQMAEYFDRVATAFDLPKPSTHQPSGGGSNAVPDADVFHAGIAPDRQSTPEK